MTTAHVVETSVTVNNSPIQDYVHSDDQTQPTFEWLLGSNLSQELVRFKLFLMHVLRFFLGLLFPENSFLKIFPKITMFLDFS